MPQTETVTLHELESFDAGLQSQTMHHDDEETIESSVSLRPESNKTRTGVLLGSSLLQLPMWGFAMSYGVFQEYYNDNLSLKGGRELTGIIGTTSNGVIYLSMPILFALFTRRWAHRRQTAALFGALLVSTSFLISSFSTDIWHLLATQGVMAALGSALIYSPVTLSLGEWYSTNNRALALGFTLSCKNIVGSTCPFLFRGLLDRYGFRGSLRVWAAICVGTSVVSILLIPTPPMTLSARTNHRDRRMPWAFLRHRTFYVYSFATILQSAGYGIPQTFLPEYAREVTLLSQTWSTLLLTLFNVPGIISSTFFGFLSNGGRGKLSASTITAISAGCSALSAFLFWGLTSRGSLVLLLVFSMTFGFFSGGYSSTWGGIINELECEAAQRNEAIDSGMLYGLLNGARGIGYVSGGLAGVPLLRAGSAASVGRFGYESGYGPLIVFTGLSSVCGGWGLLWKWTRLSQNA
ncbi:putative monocarboxylate transporter [Pseudovirgaria hyperparasitica]|uniref:Putative monocarboxylate transporter n=1 Tax=Pseudovirgaria hyperparasitica TaxID=470096 RepID=A0A6A6VSX7_9PEZI|nr:putative monocarboxylate transporter [Pseudovirgaria hyperparasitica]KAF2753323.1 putative monocarboxylate transporter [Pseudovirgaria hyperparasitica]